MSVRPWLLGLFGFAIIAGSSTTTDAGAPLALRVSPAVAFAPANLNVRATVEADKDNRSIEIIAESSEFYRASAIELDGDRAPRTNTFEFRSLPPGTYSVQATLFTGSGNERARVRQEINVIASGGR
jgi:hypothetical protein